MSIQKHSNHLEPLGNPLKPIKNPQETPWKPTGTPWKPHLMPETPSKSLKPLGNPRNQTFYVFSKYIADARRFSVASLDLLVLFSLSLSASLLEAAMLDASTKHLL